jgi:tetratricopeptide (TPR) repeat protein
MMAIDQLTEHMTNHLRRVARFSFVVLLAGVVACSGRADARRQQHLERGNRYFDQAKYREAAIEFRNAVQIDPRSGQARLKLAQSLERLGDGQNAYQEYVRAADLLPDDLDVQLTAGSYLLAAKQFDDAKLRAEAVLARDDDNLQAHVLLGNALAGLRNLDQAIQEIEQAIELDPTRGATFANLGLLETQRGQREKAEAAFKRSIALKPEWVPGHLALANHYWATGRVADAERELTTALKLEPRNPIANRAMALLYIGSKRGTAAEPYARALAQSGATPFALADYYLLQNRPDEAIAQLEQLRTHERIGAEAGRRLARAYEQKGDREAARRVVRDVLAANAKDPEALLLDGQLLFQEGRIDEALAQLNAAARLDAQSVPVQFALGRVHASRGDYDQARQAFATVLQLNPRAAAAQVELSRLDLVTGRVESSLQHARDAVRNEPANVDAQTTLVRGLIAARQLVEADAKLRPLLSAQPNNAALHVQRGLLAAARGERAGARQAFE